MAICRDLDAKRELSVALGKLGHVEHDAATRSAIYEEAVAVARECGDPMQLAHAVRHLGDVARHAGETAVAERCYEEALGLYRNEAAPPVLDFANALRPMAILKADTGELEEARELWRTAGGALWRRWRGTRRGGSGALAREIGRVGRRQSVGPSSGPNALT